MGIAQTKSDYIEAVARYEDASIRLLLGDEDWEYLQKVRSFALIEIEKGDDDLSATLAFLPTDQLAARKVALILELRALAVPGTTPLSDPRVVEAARDIRTINNLLDARGVSTLVD